MAAFRLARIVACPLALGLNLCSSSYRSHPFLPEGGWNQNPARADIPGDDIPVRISNGDNDRERATRDPPAHRYCRHGTSGPPRATTRHCEGYAGGAPFYRLVDESKFRGVFFLDRAIHAGALAPGCFRRRRVHPFYDLWGLFSAGAAARPHKAVCQPRHRPGRESRRCAHWPSHEPSRMDRSQRIRITLYTWSAGSMDLVLPQHRSVGAARRHRKSGPPIDLS